MRPFALEIAAGDFALAARSSLPYRHCRLAGTLNSAMAFSTAAASTVPSQTALLAIL